MINKYNRQSLGNQIEGFPQNKKILNNLKRSLRKRKKHVKNSNNKIVNRWNNYTGNNDINEEDTSLNAARFPIWQVLESTLAVINLDSTTNPSIMETEIINQPLLAFEKPPSQLENLDHSMDKAIFPVARRYPNSRRLLDLNASNKNLILSRIASPKSEITVNVQSPAFKGLNNKISNKRYLLVPVSKNLYVLKNVRESSRTGVDGIIIPKRYKLLEKDKDNATSAILSFKAHMHHDVKDVGRAYLQRGNLHLFDHDMNYLYSTLESRVYKENENPTENPAWPTHLDFLYPDITFQTDPNLIDVTSKISEEQVVSPVPDYENISLVDINLRGRINFYDLSTLSSPSSFDISDYDVTSKKIANHGQLSTLSAAKLNEVNPIQQNSRNYGNSLKYSFGVELTTTDFRDTFDTLDEYIYTPATLENVEIDLINNKEVFDTPQSREDDPKFLTESNEDKSITDFIDDTSTQYRVAFDASANEDNTFFPNITNCFVNNGILNSQDIDNQEYGISISSEYNNKMSTHFNDFYYNNRSIDEVLFTNYITKVDLFLNKEDYVTSAPLLLNTDKWPLKKAQSNVENSNALLMAIKPLSSELQKLLSAIQLVNQSISNVQSRLCDKKNVGSARTERESKNRNATNITKLVDKVDYYDSDFSTKSFNNQSLDKRRIEIEGKSVAEHDVKIRRTIFLNKFMTPFHKRKSSISDLEVQNSRKNFLKKRKLSEREFSKSGDRLPHSRFNRNLKSLTKNYKTRMKPIQQFSGLKKMKRTTTPILRLPYSIKSDISSENFTGDGQNHQENDQINRSIISPDNTPSLNISGSGKEKKFHPTDPQFYKEATAYLDILGLLGKTKNVEYATDVWTTQKLMESLPPLIFTTTEFFVSTLTFLPYFTEAPTITASSTIAEKKDIFEITKSSLYEYITSTIMLSTSIIPMSTTLPLLYMTELTMEETAISITDLTITPVVAITTEVSEISITIPMIENFTIKSVMLLTPFLEGMTDITLKITIPVVTKTSIEEISSLIAVTVVTEEKIGESISTSSETEIIQSSFIETNISLYTFSTAPLFRTTQTELMIETTTSTVAVLTTLTITKPQTTTSKSTVGENITLHEAESTTAIASSSTVLEQTVAITTLIPEDESPVSQIEKTITAEETATEVPTTIETSTSTETLTTAMEIPTTIKATTITETSILTEILTTLKTPITEETTSTKTSTPSTTLTSLKTKTTEISTTSKTSTITEILFIKTTITEILPINKTVTTAETPTTIETSTASKILTISTIPTTIVTTTTETLTSTEILTTYKTPIIKETTGAKTITSKTLTPIKTKITIETSSITEISTSIEITKITEILTTNKSTTTVETSISIETLKASEIPTISTIPTTTATTMKTFTKISTTYKTSVIKETTSAETLTSIKTSTPIEKTTTETSTIIEISTTIETTTISKILTITDILTTTETAFTEISTTSEISMISTIPTITETTVITKTLTSTEIIATTKIPTIKKTVSTKGLTPTITETPSSTEIQIITEILTITESLGSTEIPVTSTTSITTVFFTTSESTTSSVTTSPKEFFPTSTLTTLTTIITTETAETILISSTTSIITLLQTLITNTTLSETPCTTISSMFLTTTKGAVTTSFKTAVSTTSLKVTTTTPLSLVTSTISSEMPNTTLSTFLIEETTASLTPMTVSSFETLHTKAALPIPTTVSTIEMFLTISSILTVNATVFSTTPSTITEEILKSTISLLTYLTVTTPSITQISIKPIMMDNGTTAYETTSTLVTSFLLTETIEGTTSSVIEYEETKESEKYYETTREEIATVTSTAKLTTTEQRTITWITTKEITIIEETTPIMFFTISFSVETTSEATSPVIETIILTTITEETLLIEKIVTVTPEAMIEEMSSLSEVTLISIETSTIPIIETSITSTSLVLTTAATTALLLEEIATEITETSLITTITTTATLSPTTKRPEYATILEAAITVTLAPFSEFILSIIITSETPVITLEVISTLPKTVSEEFTMSTTESPSITYATQISILLIETTIYPIVSISAEPTEESLEAETEYYVAKEPFYEEEYEEYEEYDTEIPTNRWYYYDEYETTTKETAVTEKYTKLLKEKTTSPPFIEGTTTSLYKIKTSEFTKYLTHSEAASTYINVTSTVATSGISYTEKITSTSTLETSTLTIVENVTTVKIETELTASAASKEVKSTTMWLTFGSTEEYTLPSSTTFKIPTESLEYLTIPPKYMDVERFTRIWLTSPKFITKPKEIPKIVLKKTTIPEQVSETETAVEKLTSFFISSALTTLPEREVIEVYLTTMSTAPSEMEGIIKTAYEVTTSAMMGEETIPSVTPFITSEAETEPVFPTMSKTVEWEQKEQLLQRLDNLKQHEKEMAEREERLKEKEKQWDIEKKKRRKMMQHEKEREKNITVTTEGYATTTTSISITSPIYTISTKNLTVSTTEIEITSPSFEISIITLSLVEITTVPTKITLFSITEKITSEIYTTEKMEEVTTIESTSVTYALEETVIPYTIQKSTSITYITKEIEEMQITDYITLTPYVTTSIMDLYNIGLASIETTTSYATKEMYTVSYVFETTPFSITEEIISMIYTMEKTEEVIEETTFTPYVTEEIEEAPYTTERSTSITYLIEEIEEMQITDYVTFTPYITTFVVDLYSIGLATIETTTPYTIREIYTTSYVTLYSEPLFVSSTITSPITLVTDKFITLPITTFSERLEEISATSVTTPTWYTTEETYIATYTDIYGKPLFTSPELEFTITLSTMTISTTTEVKYYEEIEKLKEELRKKERELEEREKILLEREKRLERDIMEFNKYMKEFEKKKTSFIPSEKSMLTSLSTPVPPTERTTIKAQLTTQIKSITEKKENQTTTKIGPTRHTEMKGIEEKKQITYIPEKTVTQEEEEIMTKRVCLNVLENTTIPFDKRRRDIVTKKICLPYFLEKNEEKESVGRLSRRLLALPSTKKIKRPRWNVPLNFRHRRREKETTRKIDNLQLSDYEWLSNNTTKPLQYFKGFTRIYRKMKKFPKKIAMQNNTTNDFQNSTSLYEQHVFDHHESVFQPTATFMLDSKKYGKKNAFFRYNLITTRKSDCYVDDKASVRKRDVSSIENNERFWSKKNTANISNEKATTAAEEDEIYTVNVLHLNYDEDKQTHEVISAKPDEDELTTILFESNDGIYVTEFEKDKKITTPNYKIEEKNEDDEISDKMEKKIEEYNDYIEDLIEDYMNYKEHETSTQTYDGRLLDNGNKDKRMTENEKELLNQTWPTEKDTMYHLGGTKLWELDFVTEPSVELCTTTDKSKIIVGSITRTTCFDVVLKRKDKIKSNISYYKRHLNNNRITKHVSIEKRDASLENITGMNALRYELRTTQPRMVAKKLKRESQKHKPNHYKQESFDKKRIVRLNDFRCTSEDSTVKNRKLCIANANKLKRQIVRHEDTNKHKKKQLAKSRTSQNLHSLYNTDNGVVNKKNAYRKTTTANQYLQVGTSFSLDEIKALNCSEYKEIQDKIVISMDSDMEEVREFPQPHYNTESLKGQKYIKLEELEDNLKSNSELYSDNDVISLPGLNLNLPCNQDGNGITWLSSISRPSYTWKRTDGIALFGFVTENGDLELRNVNAKDTGNYTCVMTYMSPDNEESVETTYEIHLQVVTLPRYIVHGENRYHVRSCDEGDLDVLVTYLPPKLNNIICEADVCNAYVLTPSCSRSQITVNILLVPTHIVKLMTVDPKRCNVFCLKAIQDKLSLILSKNLQIFLGKTIIFRLPHYEQRLVPIVEKSSFARRKRGKTDANVSAGRSSNIGLFSSCPAGYGLRDTHCVPCDVGTYSEDGISHCKRCSPGTYQPNHGARVCRTCTNPTTKGCYNMLWNSFSAVMVTLASIGAMLSICLLSLWIICCAKKKFCVKRIAGLIIRENTFEGEKHVEEQSLIKANENEDQQWDSEYKAKKKKGKLYLHEDEWGSHRIKNVPIISPDSYRSHEDYNNRKHLLIYKHMKSSEILLLYINVTFLYMYVITLFYVDYPKRSCRKGPRLPECDFDT
ncbi:PREDICTED: uncharacterized protein LOC108764244 [Trachymyrmex cornetzi]|uniref:uncharacterized protein LOC108764244 n=1 Tax=Trachymyrmex cornetzi TaxID=471704 RepID=UPI00084EEF89|nr:PREDICTED: uncharacterized protein LOC108764244 [Trachymyrmex cornetzi]